MGVVEQTLDNVFGALANHHRRDILRRVTKREETASSLAKLYGMTLAAVAKHIGILESAGLIKTEKRGKERFASLSPAGFNDAKEYFAYYEQFWNDRLDALGTYLAENP